MMNSLSLTAAEILAAAVFELFPNIQLINGGATSYGFFYDFEFPHPIHPELHLQIEEKMRQIVKENREIRCLEMVAFSAREFLKSKGHFLRAEQMEEGGLFSIFQMGSFADLCSGSVLSSSKELSAFKLFPVVALDQERIRVLGVANASKDGLKEFLKKWQRYPRVRHEEVGLFKDFWMIEEGKLIWLEKGILAKENLISRFKQSLFEGVFQVELSKFSLDRVQKHQKIMKKMNVSHVGEVFSLIENGENSCIEELGLLDSMEKTVFHVTAFVKNLTSSLQSIRKTLNILGFECEVFCCFKRKDQTFRLISDALKTLGWSYQSEDGHEGLYVDFRVADGLGRMWSSARLWVKEVLFFQLIVERNLALLIEKDLV